MVLVIQWIAAPVPSRRELTLTPQPESIIVFHDVKLIDLSVPLQHQAVSEPFPASIQHITHAEEGLAQMRQLFGVAPEDLVYSGGEGWAIDDLKRCLDRIDYRLRPFDIVLLQTDADKRIDQPDYFRQPGLGRESTLWLVDQGVKVIGIDAYTLDRPFADMVEDFRQDGDGRHIWPAHFAGITREYCQIEKLSCLDQIPVPHGFLVSCLPVKIEAASAAWCRAVAIVPNTETTLAYSDQPTPPR